MNVSYDEIRRIYRLEKNTGKLVEVEEDFFDSLNDFLEQEKASYLESLKELSSSRARDYINLKKIAEEIFLIRQKKLLNKALVCSRTGELSEEKMALQEKKILDEMLGVLSSHRACLQGVFEEEKADASSGRENVSVVLIKDVPSFVGADMKEYGPFEKDASVHLPFKIANLLISRNLAKQE